MRQRALIFCCLTLFALSSLLLTPASAHTTTSNVFSHQNTTPQTADFPTVDPNYIYGQLSFMIMHFQRREAGYGTNLPGNINGHDGFADYWAQELARNLQGFGPQIRRDEFPIKGWVGRPALVPAFNVEVSVPGAVHPEQVVVIGCHYDAEAVSTQSANDDASGCAIELGVAQAMGSYWRAHHTYPTRTLRFVIFDAEEQGLLGSFHYLNSTVNGDVKNIVAMFNEEQNGIAYPLRYLGQMKNPLLPFNIDMSPLQNSTIYPEQDKLSPAQRNAIIQFRSLMGQAVPAVFQQFQALGYLGLTYHTDNQQDTVQPVFTPDQLKNIHQEDDTLGSSDQIPFTLAGLPCATFAGNSSYYDNNPPAWSYPFDQKEDTIQMMNTFADGSSHKSNALTLALAIPGMLTTWMLNQAAILGQTDAFSQKAPLAAISDIGQTQVGQSLTLDAKASFDPNDSTHSLTYAWNFGDGTKASGITVHHTYLAAGHYTLTLAASSQTGIRQVSKTIDVVPETTAYSNPYAKYPVDGNPPSNPQVILPTPNDTLSDKVLHTLAVPSSPTSTSTLTPILVIIVGLILAIILIVFLRRRAITLKKQA